VVEYYFSDSYQDQKAAVQKAEVFLSIYDYIGVMRSVFQEGLVEKLEAGLWPSTGVARAVHHVFTAHFRRTSSQENPHPGQGIPRDRPGRVGRKIYTLP